MQRWVIFLLTGLLIGVVGGFTGRGGGLALVPILLLMGFETHEGCGNSLCGDPDKHGG